MNRKLMTITVCALCMTMSSVSKMYAAQPTAPESPAVEEIQENDKAAELANLRKYRLHIQDLQAFLASVQAEFEDIWKDEDQAEYAEIRYLLDINDESLASLEKTCSEVTTDEEFNQWRITNTYAINAAREKNAICEDRIGAFKARKMQERDAQQAFVVNDFARLNLRADYLRTLLTYRHAVVLLRAWNEVPFDTETRYTIDDAYSNACNLLEAELEEIETIQATVDNYIANSSLWYYEEDCRNDLANRESNINKIVDQFILTVDEKWNATSRLDVAQHERMRLNLATLKGSQRIHRLKAYLNVLKELSPSTVDTDYLESIVANAEYSLNNFDGALAENQKEGGSKSDFETLNSGLQTYVEQCERILEGVDKYEETINNYFTELFNSAKEKNVRFDASLYLLADRSAYYNYLFDQVDCTNMAFMAEKSLLQNSWLAPQVEEISQEMHDRTLEFYDYGREIEQTLAANTIPEDSAYENFSSFYDLNLMPYTENFGYDPNVKSNLYPLAVDLDILHSEFAYQWSEFGLWCNFYQGLAENLTTLLPDNIDDASREAFDMELEGYISRIEEEHNSMQHDYDFITACGLDATSLTTFENGVYAAKANMESALLDLRVAWFCLFGQQSDASELYAALFDDAYNTKLAYTYSALINTRLNNSPYGSLGAGEVLSSDSQEIMNWLQTYAEIHKRHALELASGQLWSVSSSLYDEYGPQQLMSKVDDFFGTYQAAFGPNGSQRALYPISVAERHYRELNDAFTNTESAMMGSLGTIGISCLLTDDFTDDERKDLEQIIIDGIVTFNYRSYAYRMQIESMLEEGTINDEDICEQLVEEIQARLYGIIQETIIRYTNAYHALKDSHTASALAADLLRNDFNYEIQCLEGSYEQYQKYLTALRYYLPNTKKRELTVDETSVNELISSQFAEAKTKLENLLAAPDAAEHRAQIQTDVIDPLRTIINDRLNIYDNTWFDALPDSYTADEKARLQASVYLQRCYTEARGNLARLLQDNKRLQACYADNAEAMSLIEDDNILYYFATLGTNILEIEDAQKTLRDDPRANIDALRSAANDALANTHDVLADFSAHCQDYYTTFPLTRALNDEELDALTLEVRKLDVDAERDDFVNRVNYWFVTPEGTDQLWKDNLAKLRANYQSEDQLPLVYKACNEATSIDEFNQAYAHSNNNSDFDHLISHYIRLFGRQWGYANLNADQHFSFNHCVVSTSEDGYMPIYFRSREEVGKVKFTIERSSPELNALFDIVPNSDYTDKLNITVTKAEEYKTYHVEVTPKDGRMVFDAGKPLVTIHFYEEQPCVQPFELTVDEVLVGTKDLSLDAEAYDKLVANFCSVDLASRSLDGTAGFDAGDVEVMSEILSATKTDATDDQKTNADFNGDGQLTISDITASIRLLQK